jgi:hypothetical protein
MRSLEYRRGTSVSLTTNVCRNYLLTLRTNGFLP